MLALTVLICVACVYFATRARISSRLPPGPRGLPFLGNVLQVPSKQLFLKLDACKRQLGDVFSLNLTGQIVIVLNTANTAADVLDRTSSVTSDRPRFIMAGDIMSQGLMLPLMQYGEPALYYPAQESEALQLVLALLHDHSDLPKSLRHAAASGIWRALFSGPSLTSEQKTHVKKIDHIAEVLAKASFPTAYLVDVFPFMQYLPAWMAGWKRQGLNFFQEADTYFMTLLNHGRQQKVAAGFISSSLETCITLGVQDHEAAWLVGIIFGGGVETTATATHSFILAMLLNPSAARKAQKEIDAVVGVRPPTFTDREFLPFVQAIVKETLRWRPPAPAGVPHVVTEAFTYNGHLFPKHALVFGNIWSINRDPAVFPDYESFRPERYLDETGNLNEPMVDFHEDLLAFGYGRRVCPGKAFAVNAMFIQIACLLWAFDFCKARDELGNEITPSSMEFVDSGANVHSAPFQCSLQPRKDNLTALIASWGAERGFLYWLKHCAVPAT